MDNELDFTPYLIKQSKEAASALNEPSTDSALLPLSQAEQDKGSGRAFTGIRALDERIATGNLNAYDYFKAKHLGINLTAYVQGDFNHKVANTSKATQGIYDTLKALELGDSIINKAQDNSGMLNGMSRWLNEKSGGLWSLNHDLAQTDNLVTNYAYSVARSLGNGKTNLEQQKDAKNMTAFRAKTKEENTSRMAQNQDINLTFLRNQIAELESLGGRVSPELYDKVQEYERKIEYINKNNGKIDLKEYNAISGDYTKYFSQNKNKGGDDEIVKYRK